MRRTDGPASQRHRHIWTLCFLSQRNPEARTQPPQTGCICSCSLGPPCFHYTQNSWLNESENLAEECVYVGRGTDQPHPGHGILPPTNTQHACTCTQQALNAAPLNSELQGRTWQQLAGPSLTVPKSATSYAPTQRMCLWSPRFREKRRWGFRERSGRVAR